MDPSNSIMKLLEEDEDETMHSGADVEAFTAALNRDIKGETSTSHPSDSDTGNCLTLPITGLTLLVVLIRVPPTGQKGNPNKRNPMKAKTSRHDENASRESQQDVQNTQQQEPLSSLVDPRQQGSGSDNQQQQSGSSQQKQFQDDFPQQQAEQSSHHKNPGHVQEPDRNLDPDSDARYQRLHNMSNQQAISTGQAINAVGRSKQVPFALLLPVIEPQLDKDKAMQLQTLYIRLKKNEISKDEFVRHMRNLVGDQMLKMAVYKLQGQDIDVSMLKPRLCIGCKKLTERTQAIPITSSGFGFRATKSTNVIPWFKTVHWFATVCTTSSEESHLSFRSIANHVFSRTNVY
ncbi:hypothetical protein RJ640_006897 [Escallonia rubra]|uniref:RST domain-containing protein n=1 Tax=Escallonia rubra TaxID=112253 RepID=A0AA88UHY2_9ASTE|nr:hypothetical protein RJ640_006897 [Escallonia rubra]